MRPSWDETFMDIVHIIAKRSTCIKKQVGCLIVKNDNIISIGYNGVPSKMEHCIDHWKNESDLEFHHEWSNINEVHAEMNAILRSKTDLSDAIIYTLFSPCIHCAKCIVSSKIKKVIYQKEYTRDYVKTKLLLWLNNIELIKSNQSNNYDSIVN